MMLVEWDGARTTRGALGAQIAADTALACPACDRALADLKETPDLAARHTAVECC